MCHSSLLKSSILSSLKVVLLELFFFSIRHKSAIGLKSGDWLGHFNTLISLSANHFRVALAVCFGSLSCWNQHSLMNPIFSTDFCKLSSKICRYLTRSILPPIIPSVPTSLKEKQPQMIMFPLPCFTGGTDSWAQDNWARWQLGPQTIGPTLNWARDYWAPTIEPRKNWDSRHKKDLN